MKKIILIIATIGLILIGSNVSANGLKSKKGKFLGVYARGSNKKAPEIGLEKKNNDNMSIFCDKTKNVEYIIIETYESAGVTLRYNQDGSVSKCSTTNTSLK